METVDAVIRARLNSDVVLIRTIGEYIIGAGGKRMRPVLLLLVDQALGYKGNHHHLMAAAVEFIHTATLLHDDVVDESDLRRGRGTANAVFGNAASLPFLLLTTLVQRPALRACPRRCTWRAGGAWCLSWRAGRRR